MKTTNQLIHIFITTIAILCFLSCDDFLNTPPADLLDSGSFYQTPAQCEQGVIGIYASLRDITNNEYLYLSEFRSDNTWVEPKTDGLRDYSEIGTFRAGVDLQTINETWNNWYKVIYNANVVLSRIPGCDFGANNHIKEQFLGEAHFLRGWAYLELARLFGNIPLIDKPLSPAEVKNISQSTALEIFNQIVIPDLKEAKDKLPLSANLKDSKGGSIDKSGRADQIAAQAMLARAYMTLAGHPFNDTEATQLASNELKAVITYSEENNNKYWAPDSTEWRKQFMPTDDYYNKYSIFAIQYRTGGTGNTALFNFSPALPPSYTNRRIFGNSAFVEKSLMYEFDKTYERDGKVYRDARGYDYSILTGFEAEPNWPAYTQITEELNLPDGNVVNVYTRSMIYKFFPSKRKIAALGMSIDAEANMKDDYDWGVNYPIIRLEDIMLMYAEILVNNDINGALFFVNKIRERAGCEPVSATNREEALEFIKRERRIELLGEGVRWFDLVRWNEWQSAITSMFDRYNNPDGTDKSNVREGRYLYPIPLSQMNVKPGFYIQNEGY